MPSDICEICEKTKTTRTICGRVVYVPRAAFTTSESTDICEGCYAKIMKKVAEKYAEQFMEIVLFK